MSTPEAQQQKPVNPASPITLEARIIDAMILTSIIGIPLLLLRRHIRKEAMKEREAQGSTEAPEAFILRRNPGWNLHPQ